MSHKKEFPGFKIPAVIDQMINDGILEDHSWHNDEAPQFVIKSSIINIPENDIGNIGDGKDNIDQSYIRIWIDHDQQPEREQIENPRWGIEKVKGYAFEYQTMLFVGNSDKNLEQMIKSIDIHYKMELK